MPVTPPTQGRHWLREPIGNGGPPVWLVLGMLWALIVLLVLIDLHVIDP